VADVRHFFAKSGGNLGEAGCVSWMFDKKGAILVDKKTVTEEKLMELALEAGAEDVVEEENEFQVVTDPENFEAVREALAASGIAFLEAAVSMVPKNTVDVADPKTAGRLMKLMDNLEDYDDVQNVYANFDIPDEVMEEIG